MTDRRNFDDIRPFGEEEFHDRIIKLIEEPYFKGIITAVMPGVDYDVFCQRMRLLHSANEFQQYIIRPWLEQLVIQTSDGFTYEGIEHIKHDKSYLYISNHRDIVLDASFLCLALLKENYPSCQIAIGSNLLIYDWICDMVRINGSFIVKRGLSGRQALEAAHHLSDYIHYAIEECNSSIWIAQREGRSKDSNDHTQEALIKMLCLGGEGTMLQRLAALHFTPVSISYEYDPCDSLKAYEFLQKSKNPDFKKCQRDDLKSMETGIMGYKGRMHFCITPCIDDYIASLDPAADKSTILQSVIEMIDRRIHANYRIYEGNYVAYDLYYQSNRFASSYSESDKQRFLQYVDKQIAKLGNLTNEDRTYVYQKMLLMYSNPLKNKIIAKEEELPNQ